MLVSAAIVYLFSIIRLSQSTLTIGDICELHGNKTGKCKRINECPSAIMQLAQNIRPKTCSYEGFMPITCCDESVTSVQPVPPNQPEDEEDFVNYGKVSFEKCHNYAGLVFQNHSSPTLMPDVLFEIEDTCAIKKENYNESFTLAREFPHLASIGYDSPIVWKCTGALISEKFVLTAATCYNLKNLGIARSVRLGSNSIRENFYHEEPLQYVNIKEFIKHPKFDEATLANNLAIIRLENPAKFTSIVRPACLGISKNYSGDIITVGWGTLSNNGYLNNEPLKSQMKIVNPTTCNGIQTNQFCVEQIPGTYWQNCLVDHGSPLQAYNKDNYCAYDIIGVLFDWKDCSSGKPAIYTNISTYIPWIEKTVWGSPLRRSIPSNRRDFRSTMQIHNSY